MPRLPGMRLPYVRGGATSVRANAARVRSMGGRTGSHLKANRRTPLAPTPAANAPLAPLPPPPLRLPPPPLRLPPPPRSAAGRSSRRSRFLSARNVRAAGLVAGGFALGRGLNNDF